MVAGEQNQFDFVAEFDWLYTREEQNEIKLKRLYDSLDKGGKQ